MDLREILKGVMLFAGLENEELDAVAAICNRRELKRGEILAEQGSPGDELFIVTHGFLEISIETGSDTPHVVVNLGQGQIIGEMSLIDQGKRSATVTAISDPAVVQVISRNDFERLCEKNSRIGYVVMRDIAADLSFKIRQRNLMVS